MIVTIVDYGMGNLRSVAKAVEALGCETVISDQPEQVRQAQRLIVPGVGACGQAMEELKRRGLIEPLVEYLNSGQPYLGICLGLQLLFESSEEDGGTPGLAFLRGRVVRFQPAPDTHDKVPHMGWNALTWANGGASGLFDGVPEGSYVYFVHSYYVAPEDDGTVSTWTEYANTRFASSIVQERVCATQFHPEKSQGIGRQILHNFVRG